MRKKAVMINAIPQDRGDDKRRVRRIAVMINAIPQDRRKPAMGDTLS